MARLLPFVKQQFSDGDGVPLAGGLIYTYLAGTSTPIATYTDQTETSENTNPIVLDANGEASIWISDAFLKIVIATADDVVLRTIDGVTSASDVTAEAAASAAAAAVSADEAEQSAIDAAASAAAALASQTAAETAATNAVTSATNAATSASTATTQATNASTSATNAATSEANALASKNAAATSAGNALTSETNAAASAAAAALGATALASYANDAAYVAANGTATAGDVYYSTSLNSARLFANGVWGSLGSGGGGGSSLNWVEDANSPLPVFEYGSQSYIWGDALSQVLYALVRVPSAYVAGSQINLRGLFYANATSNTVLMQTVSTLIRTGTDAMSSVTNQRTSTNSAITLATTANRPNSFVCDLTSSSGQVNSVAVSAGDLLIVKLQRGTGTSTADATVPVYSTEVTFS